MRTDLKTPCKHCPFRNDETRIRFAARERAEEIGEQAYRDGFPCHLSAEYIEGPDGEGGFHARDAGQHCAGALIMYTKSEMGAWPGIDNDEELFDRLEKQLDFNAPVFDGPDEFLDANTEDVAEWEKREAARNTANRNGHAGLYETIAKVK